MASQASEAIETQRTMADSLGLPFSQWNAGSSETSHASSDFATIPAMQDTPNTHDAHDVQNASPRIDRTESIRFSNSLTTSVTADFQPVELRTEEYVTKQQKIIAEGPAPLSDQAINWIKATEDVQLEIIDADLSESLKQVEIFAKICDLNECSAAKVKDLEAAEPVQDTNNELAAAHQDIDELEEEL
ncbi:hypothetical protein K440DRAFT_644312 [Wilcoxina mikolae CBS 423.85]|nr:hypothetical protein K440DRAFT_644312 [Wilcoxina mikolae CBS 423.85]